MVLSLMGRRALKAIRDGRDLDQVPEMSRAGVMGSLAKKGFIKRRNEYSRWEITHAGRRALKRKSQKGQRKAYMQAHGLRKLHGLNPIIRSQPRGS
jgi:hypothetical protein